MYPGSSFNVIGKEVQSRGAKQAVAPGKEVFLIGACCPFRVHLGSQKKDL